MYIVYVLHLHTTSNFIKIFFAAVLHNIYVQLNLTNCIIIHYVMQLCFTLDILLSSHRNKKDASYFLVLKSEFHPFPPKNYYLLIG